MSHRRIRNEKQRPFNYKHIFNMHTSETKSSPSRPVVTPKSHPFGTNSSALLDVGFLYAKRLFFCFLSHAVPLFMKVH